MTREEFVKAYAERSGRSGLWALLGFIETEGRYKIAMPCACDSEDCPGWAMVTPESIDDHLRLDAPEPLRTAYREAVEKQG